jgi:hypothetical protein
MPSSASFGSKLSALAIWAALAGCLLLQLFGLFAFTVAIVGSGKDGRFIPEIMAGGCS